MSKKVYDENGHLQYEITEGQSQRVTDAQGNYVGKVNHRGEIVTDKGTVVDKVKPSK